VVQISDGLAVVNRALIVGEENKSCVVEGWNNALVVGDEDKALVVEEGNKALEVDEEYTSCVLEIGNGVLDVEDMNGFFVEGENKAIVVEGENKAFVVGGVVLKVVLRSKRKPELVEDSYSNTDICVGSNGGFW